jgi:hypothetical protein
MTERGKRRRKNKDGEKTREGRKKGEETTRSEEKKLEEKADPVLKHSGSKSLPYFRMKSVIGTWILPDLSRKRKLGHRKV